MVAELDWLASRALPRQELFAELGPRLRRGIPNDACCWHTLDPSTGLITSGAPVELITGGVFTAAGAAAAGALLVRSEYFTPDVNGFADLAARRVPVGRLDLATRGRLARSPRFRELLAPAGIPHELRAAFVIRGRPWGAVHIARREHRAPFSESDARTLARVLAPIARAIRSSLRADAARTGTGPDAPGMILLGADDAVELVTPLARELIAELSGEGGDAPERPPFAVLGLAAHLRALAKSEARSVVVPGARGWITLHGSRPDGASSGRVAVVIERATGPQVAPLRLELHGVTAREAEIARLLARGLTSAQIATSLVVSPHTVHDHVRSLYEKLGVGSRQQLLARIFLDEYQPAIAAGAPLDAHGRLAPDASAR